MHIHDYRPRLLVGHAGQSTEIARFRCSNRDECGAVVQVIPALLARHLWRSWETVETAMEPAAPRPSAPDAEPLAAVETVPERTRRRWRARLAASAAVLIAALATALGASTWLGGIVKTVGRSGSRAKTVAAFRTQATPLPSRGLVYAALAAVLHRVAPGLRLM
jgi:hypothetical protein